VDPEGGKAEIIAENVGDVDAELGERVRESEPLIPAIPDRLSACG
jgi:hypothetical protein